MGYNTPYKYGISSCSPFDYNDKNIIWQAVPKPKQYTGLGFRHTTYMQYAHGDKVCISHF